MTSQEVRALIDAKIKGQGTNVDAGSVLPAILNGILDLIDSGGGGGTSDAVQYIPQILTEPQQMQARKNQGLYYSEGTPAGVISWDGNTEGKERIELEEGSDIWLYKIADSPVNIPAEKISSVLDANGDAINMQIQDASNVFESGRLVYGHAYSVDYQQYYSIAIANNPQNPSDSSIQAFVGLTGIYVTDNVRTINYDAYDGAIHQIPAKYIPQTIPVVKIEIPSNDKMSYGIGYVLLNNSVTNRDVVFSIEGKTINQVAVRDMLDTTSTGDVWSFETGNTYTFDTSGYYLVEIEVQETPSSSAYYYATVFVETINL